MAEKILTQIGLSTGLNFVVTLMRDADGFVMDSADGIFKDPTTVGIAPANAYTELAIDGTNTQIYQYSESRVTFNDGTYTATTQLLAGAVSALDTDRIFSKEKLIVRGDKIVERSYTYGDESSIPVDVKTVVEDGVNSIIAALGVTIGADYEGVATGGSNTTVVESLAMWNVDIWASTGDLENLCVIESAASGERYGSKIVSNTNNTLTIGALAGAYTVVAGDKFYIKRNSNAVDVKSIGATAQTGVDLGVQVPLINTKLDTLETSLTSMESKQDTIITNQGTTETAIDLLAPATTPTTYNLTMAADTENSQALPAGTKKYQFVVKDGTPGETLRWAWVSGEVAAAGDNNTTIDQSNGVSEDNVNLTGKTLYFATSNICVIALEVWQ